MSQDATIGTASASAGFIAGVTTSIVATIGYLGIAFIMFLSVYVFFACYMSQKTIKFWKWERNPRNWCWNPVRLITNDCREERVNVEEFMLQKNM